MILHKERRSVLYWGVKVPDANIYFINCIYDFSDGLQGTQKH